MKRIKLAIITSHPIQYNAPWFRLLAERKNIQVKVFYTWSQVEHEEKFDPGFGKVIEWDIPLLEGYDYTFVKNTSRNPGSKTYSGIINPTLIKEIENWNPDAVLVFGWKFDSHRKVLRFFKNKIPVLFRGDSTLLNRPEGIKSFFRHLVLKGVYRNIDCALYVGAENKNYFLKAGLNDSQLKFVPHAIDNKRFYPSEDAVKKGLRFRRFLKIESDDLVFLFAGKFESVKNPHLLLDVAIQMKNADVHFVFAGNGPLEQQMKYSVSSHIHFLDFQNQEAMPGLYQMCDVYVLPSLSETWGLSVNEAMAAGKPVLVSDKCGCAIDLVKDGVTGLVFNSNDAQDLQNKIERMVSDKKKLKEMGRNAFEKIQNWSFEKIVDAVENIAILMKEGTGQSTI